MTNKEIAQRFSDLAKIMELHDENPFKIRSYNNAYLQLRKVSTPLLEMSDAEIGGIKGVGNAISGKIRELEETGELETYKKYSDITFYQGIWSEKSQSSLERTGSGKHRRIVIRLQ
jgi:DNA polymerase (family 10)